MILSITVDSGGGWIDYASLLFSFITAVIAFFALYTWRVEKSYDIYIDALSKSRPAYRMIKHLRVPISSLGEIDNELHTDFIRKKGGAEVNRQEEAYLIFISRMKRYDQLYREMQTLREVLWAHFGENHAFVSFYDFVLLTIIDMENAHSQLIIMEGESREARGSVIDYIVKARATLYEVTGDEISTRLDDLYNKVLLQRKVRKGWKSFKQKIRKIKPFLPIIIRS